MLLNPKAKELEKKGFKIFIGDQSDLIFKIFFRKIEKIDVLIDDGGRQLQQVTTLMESIKYINLENDVIEDTYKLYER